MDFGSRIVIDSPETVMLSHKSSGQSQKNQPLRDVPNGADVKQAVMEICTRTELKSTAFVLMVHTCHKQKFGYVDLLTVIKSKIM